LEDVEARDRVAHVERLLDQVEELGDPVARDTATELVQALLELYGGGLERVLALADATLVARLADDELIAHLLLLHGLHPVPVEERVRSALEEVRPYLQSHGGNVDLLGVEEGVVRLRLQGSCSGCPSSSATLQLAIEDAIRKAAPDVEDIRAEGAVEAAPAPIVPPVNGHAHWTMAGGLPELSSGGRLLKEVAGEPVLFVKLERATYAYRPVCTACGGSLDEAQLDRAELVCPSCAHHYDVRRAGRCLDEPQLHLDPIPLLHDASGLVKVALA
jgi:Fe-S cluster biogenesis protein NfuA/nitrite reductase/ring-hydroxylating ferredoxin subunit